MKESWAASPETRRSMQANKRSGTAPELAVRRLVYRAGLRYRVDYPLPISGRRRADLAFPAIKLAVFIDGCFWHGCPEHFGLPKSNVDFWSNKIEGNRIRDVDTNVRLRDAGWAVLRFWEHDAPEDVARCICEAVHLARGVGF